ncbi:MAG: hypothetical protein WC499_02485 [Patescibacteria group bacterium]
MKKTEINELKQESILKQFLTGEVKFVMGIVTISLGVIAPYYAIRQDIALIQQDISIINTNHEAHIQDILQEIKEMKTAEIELQKQILLISNN